ncbi:enoyl-CoA hydratase-related protein [Pontibacillus litoralis]|uniref:Enoyl-CoA hydratase n=1 Tax=Pontibacillus litoralis JSM 072002 TaxID=1385512 RepID=A0A0A5G6U3_9BACI|nr:enoyl-CoA hydratase-related protein [Pontibacillus litoralis]KGX86888.1 enoyl-CoA hydratase [Pontibacillus litoralis JSM 072002]
MYETIQYDVIQQVATITLHRPAKLNAITLQLNAELSKALKQASHSDDVRVIILTGEGRAFCSGQDLTLASDDVDYGDVLRTSYGPVVRAMEECEKPIIAAVNGVAAGAGFSLALACDFRLMSEKASFVQAFVQIGLIPDAGNLYYLSKLVGHAKALELSLLGGKVTAEEAKALHLATKVIPEEQWEEQVNAFAHQLANMPTKTMGLIKRNLKASWNSTLPEFLEAEANGQKIAGLTNDHKEGVQAFLDKRPPLFQGN